MLRNARELWLSVFAILAITALYGFVLILTRAIPAASEFLGHSLGVLGFILMIMTEILYSLRKRSSRATWGKMSSWLQFHIFTGLVGPYMVLLHSSWKFNGLASIVMLLTIIIVVSGFIGRYIFTAVPRTADGVALEANQLEQQVTAIQGQLQSFEKTAQLGQLKASQFVEQPAGSATGCLFFITRPFNNVLDRISWWQRRQRAAPQAHQQLRELENLVRRRRVLQGQLESLAFSRRLLSVWHAVHIPIGMALFASAFIHVLAALYYATLLR